MNDLSVWITAVSAIVACFAAWRAYVSSRVAERSLAILEQQEVRRRPALVPYLIAGYSRRRDGGNSKVYGFSVSISNRSDSDNAITHLELEVRYTNPQGVCMKIKVPHEAGLAGDLGGGEIRAFEIPTRIDAHQAIAGWALFNVNEALLGGSGLDGYTLVLTDTHGTVSALEPSMTKEVSHV